MSDLHLRLLRDATDSADVTGFWQAAAETIRGWADASAVSIDYMDASQRGTGVAGRPSTAQQSESVDWHGSNGARVTLGVSERRADIPREELTAVAQALGPLALMVGRRAALERDRRLGTFLVELSRWLMAAPESDVLLRYTLQSVMALVEAHGAYVALRQGGDDVLRVVTALGDAAPLRGVDLTCRDSTTGRVVRTGEALLSADLDQEPDASSLARHLMPGRTSAMIAPIHTASGVIGAVTVFRREHQGAPSPRIFELHDLHYFTAVAAHIAGGLELSQALATTRAAANRARAMVNSSPLPMVVVDQNGRVDQLNEAALKILALDGESAAIGRHLEGLGLSPSGTTLRLVLAGRQEGDPWHGRVLVTQPSGERRICDCTVTGLAGLGSKDLLVALYDRTDELRAQRELIAREKLATVGEIASGVAHEVNNPLTAIRMEAELLGRGSRDADTSAAADTIIREVDRAARIVRSLLRLARRSDTAPTRVQLNELVRDVAEIRQRVLRSDGIVIRTVMDHGAPAVVALGQELQQVVINLVTNAEHAVRGRQPAEIHLTTRAHGGWVSLTVEDSGPGIARDARDRVFDPFFTTKGPDEGSGLGLAICQRVVAEVGGRIWIEESTALGGAKFVVELPAAPDAPTNTIG